MLPHRIHRQPARATRILAKISLRIQVLEGVKIVVGWGPVTSDSENFEIAGYFQ